MRRIAFPFALVLLLLSLAQAQQPTVDQRLQQLEQRVDRLYKHLNLPSEEEAVAPVDINVKFGQPACDGQILPKPHYIICYVSSLKDPRWVTYHLTAADLQGTASRQNDFRPDPELPEGQRAELSDYSRSGFDRGHMAPAGDFKRDATSMSDTFVLSNMTPQTPNLNRIMWEHLEEQVRALVQVHGQIWIVTGALFLDADGKPTQPTQFIGTNHVAVPTHLYKVILCEHKDGSREMFAFVMPNQRARLSGAPKDYIRTVKDVEQMSGLDFFAALPKAIQDHLESIKATNWPIQIQ